MHQLSLLIPMSKKPFYLRLAQAITLSIQQGQVIAGEKLPTARALAEQLQVNRHTIMRSYAELIAQGWVENVERSHYRVSRLLPIISSVKLTTEKSNVDERAAKQVRASANIKTIINEDAPFVWSIQKEVHESNFIKSTAGFTYNFAGGKPDTDLFPFDEYRSHVSDALKKPIPASLHYGENQGDRALIAQGLIYLRRTRNVRNKSLMITNGSQEALFLVSQLLLKAGDKVAVEPFGYPPAWSAFQAAGAQLISIKQDSQGLVPVHLKEMAAKHSLKCIYLTPLHQYPTTVTLNATRRLEIYEIARQYQLFIIEDDYDHEFHYKCQPIAPMAATDPDNIVIYLTSFSKIMFPAARAGMLAIPKAILQPLVNYRTTVNHKPAMLLQSALARWMASGGFERHIRRCTKAYQERYQNAQLQLQAANASGAHLQCNIPDGGMALWIKTTIDTQQLAALLAKQGIYIQHQAEFCFIAFTAPHVDDDNVDEPLLNHLLNNELGISNNPNIIQNKPSRYFRLGFAGQNIAMFNAGFNEITDLVLTLQHQQTIQPA
ncbi:MAG: GntR family transcriptional regulator/MocR family aminotransferase [Oceanospirillaceae bacterium]|jgi:GntR family transcriptional regulator/MocR family aminotransferase